jgi:hypothetical protein
MHPRQSGDGRKGPYAVRRFAAWREGLPGSANHAGLVACMMPIWQARCLNASALDANANAQRELKEHYNHG